MRKIKFRGKRSDNGEWVYGGYFSNGHEHFIVNFAGFQCKWVEVLPETIGQFTGLFDKDGKEVFEGDWVQTLESEATGDVQFSHGVFGIEWDFAKESKSMVGTWGQLHNLRTFDDGQVEFQVIGNIHDNN